MTDEETTRSEAQPRKCYCPDDCNCHYPWRFNYCGCKGHEEQAQDIREIELLGA